MTTASAAAELPPASAILLSDAISVAAGAVVSRTLAKGAAGTLTLFAFDRGEGLSEHSAPFDATVLVLEGRLELRIGGQPVLAEPGHAVRMPASVPHALLALEPTKMLLVMLRQPA